MEFEIFIVPLASNDFPRQHWYIHYGNEKALNTSHKDLEHSRAFKVLTVSTLHETPERMNQSSSMDSNVAHE
jgi:hypothetical protein